MLNQKPIDGLSHADTFTRRLAEPVPARAYERLAEIWEQPMFIWGVSISPTNESFRILDAGECGHREVLMNGNQVSLRALPPLALWNGMVTTMANALDTGRRKPNRFVVSRRP